MEELLTVGYYNGWDPFFESLASYLEREMGIETTIRYPEYGDVVFKDENEASVDFVDFEADMFPRVFWSFLVVKYGDYGTSPRFGWIDSQNAMEIIKSIHERMAEQEELDR